MTLTPRTSFVLLAVLAAVSWGIPVLEYVAYGALSLMSLATAFMLTAMLIAWPWLNGRRVAHGHVERARMCLECRSLAWPAEQTLGFCLRCGSTRPPVTVSG
jgi:hypothetical protein